MSDFYGNLVILVAETHIPGTVYEIVPASGLVKPIAKEVFKPYEGVFANAKAATEANISALNAQVAKTAA